VPAIRVVPKTKSPTDNRQQIVLAKGDLSKRLGNVSVSESTHELSVLTYYHSRRLCTFQTQNVASAFGSRFESKSGLLSFIITLQSVSMNLMGWHNATSA
jgi:hypothetical protein